MTDQTPRPSLSDRYWRLPWPARIGLIIVAVVGAFAVIAQIPDPQPASRPATAGPSAAAPARQPATPAGQIGPGEWLVGTDIQPGTYRSDGPAEGDYCMWSRKDAAGVHPLDNILASDGTYEPGQMLVTIEPGDVVFRTNGCAPWERIG